MKLKRVLFFTVMIAFIASSSVYGVFYPIVGSNQVNLVYDSTGKLDLTNNSAIIQVSPLYAGVWSAIVTGYNSGTWTGLEITSSVCANPANGYIYALGLASISEYQGLYGTHAGFYGPTAYPGSLGVDDVNNDLPSTATLIKFTYVGDATLDGAVESADLTIVKNAIANGKLGSPPTDTWVHGDVNYDGAIESGDLTIVKNSIANQKAGSLVLPPLPLSGGGIVPIPEPSTIVLLLLGFASLFTFKKVWK